MCTEVWRLEDSSRCVLPQALFAFFFFSSPSLLVTGAGHIDEAGCPGGPNDSPVSTFSALGEQIHSYPTWLWGVDSGAQTACVASTSLD